MRIDLFELLEGLFRGIVFFIYNFIETIYWVTIHPCSGPILLNRRHRDRRRRQMSGMTFLFLCFFFWVTVSILYNYRADVREQKVFNTLYQANGVDSEVLWAALIASLLGLIIVDAVPRLLTLYSIPGPRYRRGLLLSAIHYSLFWPVTILMGGSFLAREIVVGTSGTELPFTIGLLILWGLALVPAATIAAQGRRWRKAGPNRFERRGRVHGKQSKSDEDVQSQGRRTHTPYWMIAGNLVGFAVLIFVSLAVATRLSHSISKKQVVRRAISDTPELALVALRCQLRGGIPEVEFLLWNKSDVPAFASPDDFSVSSKTHPSGVTSKKEPGSSSVNLHPYRLHGAASWDGFPTPIQSGGFARITGLLPPNGAIKPQSWCHLTPSSGRVRLARRPATGWWSEVKGFDASR